MKKTTLLVIVLCICTKSFGQDSLRVFGRTNFNIEYFYDSNENNKIVVNKTNGVYEFRIPIKSNFKKITIHERGNNECSQDLYLVKLLDYVQTNKTKEILNDLTHINNCVTTDTLSAAPEYEKYIGQWKGNGFVMNVQPDIKFYLGSKSYKRFGYLESIDKNTIALVTEYVIHPQTGTYEDKSETMKFKFENESLVSEDTKINLRKSD